MMGSESTGQLQSFFSLQRASNLIYRFRLPRKKFCKLKKQKIRSDKVHSPFVPQSAERCLPLHISHSLNAVKFMNK